MYMQNLLFTGLFSPLFCTNGKTGRITLRVLAQSPLSLQFLLHQVNRRPTRFYFRFRVCHIGHSVKVKLSFAVDWFLFRSKVLCWLVFLWCVRLLLDSLAPEFLLRGQIRPVLMEITMTHARRCAPVAEEIFKACSIVELGIGLLHFLEWNYGTSYVCT